MGITRSTARYHITQPHFVFHWYHITTDLPDLAQDIRLLLNTDLCKMVYYVVPPFGALYGQFCFYLCCIHYLLYYYLLTNIRSIIRYYIARPTDLVSLKLDYWPHTTAGPESRTSDNVVITWLNLCHWHSSQHTTQEKR